MPCRPSQRAQELVHPLDPLKIAIADPVADEPARRDRVRSVDRLADEIARLRFGIPARLRSTTTRIKRTVDRAAREPHVVPANVDRLAGAEIRDGYGRVDRSPSMGRHAVAQRDMSTSGGLSSGRIAHWCVERQRLSWAASRSRRTVLTRAKWVVPCAQPSQRSRTSSGRIPPAPTNVPGANPSLKMLRSRNCLPGPDGVRGRLCGPSPPSRRGTLTTMMPGPSAASVGGDTGFGVGVGPVGVLVAGGVVDGAAVGARVPQRSGGP